MTDTTLDTRQDYTSKYRLKGRIAALLVAWSPEGFVTTDRCRIGDKLIIGRSSSADLTVRDQKVSKQHCVIKKTSDGYTIEDLGSTNGTFAAGTQVVNPRRIDTGTVIRVGQSIFVFHDNAAGLLEPPPVDRFGMAGKFHVGPQLRGLMEAAVSKRHVLVTGPSGAGKEVAARALAGMIGKGTPLPLLSHNAARHASPEEAASTIFGVGARIFSSVDARPGLIEKAQGGVLFLDEIHNLPEKVQRSLLRVIEDGKTARIGETTMKDASVRFVFASNAPGPTFGLAHDLLARLRVVHVGSLVERTADAPSIFLKLLEQAFAGHNISEKLDLEEFDADFMEMICLDGFSKTNVRGLVDLADRLATKVALGIEFGDAVSGVVDEALRDSPVLGRVTQKVSPSDPDNNSRYERHKDAIIDIYRQCEKNISATQRVLDEHGFKASRRWLRHFLKLWGEHA